MSKKHPPLANKWLARRKTVRRIYPERRAILRLRPERRRRPGRRDEDKAEVSAREQKLTNAMKEAGAHGAGDPRLATALHNLAIHYYKLGKYADAEPLYKRAMAIRETVFKPTHPHIIQSLNDLAALYYAQGRYAATEPLLKRIMEIIQSDRGQGHPMFAQALENYAELLQARGRLQEAGKMAALAQDLLFAKRSTALASQDSDKAQEQEEYGTPEDTEDLDLAHPNTTASQERAED